MQRSINPKDQSFVRGGVPHYGEEKEIEPIYARRRTTQIGLTYDPNRREVDDFDDDDIHFTDKWCDNCFEHVPSEMINTHSSSCRPHLPNFENLRKAGVDVDEMPYVNERLFKCSKAMTKFIANQLKTKEGLFLETSAIDNLKAIRDIADGMSRNQDNYKKQVNQTAIVEEVALKTRGLDKHHNVYFFMHRMRALANQKLEFMGQKYHY